MGRGTRQRLPLVVVAFGLAMTPLVPASCIEDLRSLEWGVVEGTQVDYTRVGYSETSSIAWNFYMVVVSVPTMPDYAVEWGLGMPALYFHWVNGSGFFPSYLYMGCAPGYPVLPIGNWTLMAEFVNSEFSVNVTDSYNYWRYSYTSRYGTHEDRCRVDFLKRDGILAHLDVELWNTTLNTKLRESSTTRAGLPIDLPIPPIILDNLAYFGAGVAVLVVALLVRRRRRVTVLAAET